MKNFSFVWSALDIAIGLVSLNQAHGEAGCLVVEVVMDQQAAPEREPGGPSIQ
jgi:hypothetical protein